MRDAHAKIRGHGSRWRQLLSGPNILSLSRIPLAGITVWLMSQPGGIKSILACATVIVAGLTDFFDGWLARRTQSGEEYSALGMTLDPLADKIFAITLLMGVLAYREFPLWLAGAIVARDLAIMLIGGIWARRNMTIPPSILPGKYYFAAVATALACATLGFADGVRYLTPVIVTLWLWSTARYISLAGVVFDGKEPAPHADTPKHRQLRMIATILVCAGLLVLFVRFVFESLAG